ncbi:MAG: hypothetical protein ABI771_05370, partial [Betaproteobacteria bacterium]
MIKVIIVTIALIVAGCSSVPFAGQRFERVILLPSESAKPSALVVKSGDAEALLDKPYAAVDIRGDRLVMTRSSPEEIARRYGELLSAEPRAPKVYTL